MVDLIMQNPIKESCDSHVIATQKRMWSLERGKALVENLSLAKEDYMMVKVPGT